MKAIDQALARNLRRRKAEPNFNPIAYKKKWYEVGRQLSQNRKQKCQKISQA